MSQQVVGRTQDLTPEELERLRARVAGELIGRLHDFGLQQRGRGLILRGRSRTYYGKQLAQHAVMRATNLPILENRIDIVPS